MGTEASVHRRQTAAAELREFIRGLIKLRSEHNGVDAAQALVDKQAGLSPFQRQMLQDRVRGIVTRVDPKPQESPSEAESPPASRAEPQFEAAPAEPGIEIAPATTASEALPSQTARSVAPQPEASRSAVTSVLDALVAKGLEEMSADLCQVFIQENDALILRAEAPADTGASGPARLSRKVGLAGQVGSLGRAVALIDLSQLTGAETIWASRGVQRLAAVGVGVAGDIGSGVLIAGRMSNRSFTEPELDEMDHLAREVSSALASADLLSRAEELAVLKERMKLAREIHDGLASDLSAVVALFKYHEHRRKTDPEDAERLLERMRTLSEGALQSARDILATLRPRQLPPVNLVESVRRQVEDFASTYGVTAVVRIEGRRLRFPSRKATRSTRSCGSRLPTCASTATPLLSRSASTCAADPTPYRWKTMA